MKLLIDTQVFIWLLNSDDRLGSKTREILLNKSNELYLSYFSVYEMIIKASIGKLNYDPSVLDDLQSMGIELLVPDKTTLQNYTLFNPDNKDPFDNAIITMAIHENCLLVTSDSRILQLSIHNLNLLNAKT
ncbi:MAG: type II toxin-antitoxin system VapC family toxin [bacterium]